MANNDALEAKKAVDDIVETFKQHNAVVAEGASILKNYSTVLVQLPTEVREMLGTFSTLLTKTREQEAEMQKAIQQTAKYTAEIEKLKLAEAKLNEQKTKNKVLTVQERVDNAQILTQEKQKALAVSSVANAYNKLNAERTIAKNKLRDLVASEQASNAEIRKAQREFDVLDQRVRKADRAVNDFSKSVGNYKTALSGVSNLMGAFGIATGLYLAADIVRNIFQTTKELQSLDLALRNVSGSQEQFAANQSFLSTLANQYGVEIKSLTKNYTDFNAAAKGIISQKEINAIFTSVSKSAAAMGLSLESTDGAFLALEQMMSKGTVQAEELKKQLGNALPGAMRAAAMAYMELHPAIKTIQIAERELMADMKKGAIDSATYIPLIVKNLEKLYGIENLEHIDTLQGAVNRLSNSWTDLVRDMSSSKNEGAIAFFSGILAVITSTTNELGRFLASWDVLYDKAKIKGAAAGKAKFKEDIGDATTKEGADGIARFDKKIAVVEIARSMSDIEQIDARLAELDKITVANLISTAALGIRLFQTRKLKLQREMALENKAFYESMYKDTNKFLAGTYFEDESGVGKGKGKGKGDKEAKSSHQINIQDKLLKEEFDMAIRMLEVARKFQEEIFNDEEKTYAERLAAREVYSKTTLDLIDAQNNREIRIEKDKAEQLLKNQTEARDKDLKSNATNVKNGFADKRIEIENRYAENVKTINYNLAQALYKIDLDYLGKNHDLQEQDFAFFEKIQKEKQRLTKETANIYFEMAQERRLKDSNDESRSLTQRQASFESWKDMAEAQLFFDEALAKSNSNQSPEALAKITAEFDKLRNSIKETLSPLQKFAKETKGWLKEFTSSFIADAGFSQTFKFFEDDFFTNIDKAFTDGLISKEEKFAAYFNAIAEMGQEAYNFLSQMSQANFEDQKQKLQEERDTALLYAGDSATGRAEIERQYQKEQKRINKQEAKAKKDMAKFNIFIDTAQAIVAFLAKGDIGASIAAGVIGAFELAAVSAKDTPQYWRGTDNAKEGLAWTQEKGREVILDNRRRLKSIGSDSGATLTKMSAGDKVLTAEQSMQYFYEEYNKLLNTNNISPFSSTLRGTPLLSARQTESQGMSDNQVEKIVSAIENKVEYRSSFDKSGFREFVSKGTVETENQNNRSQGIGKNV